MHDSNASVHVDKKWGYETQFVNNELYCGKRLTVLPNGFACSIHYHLKKRETFFIERGALFLEIFRPLAGLDSKLVLGQPITLADFQPRPNFRFMKVGEKCTLHPYIAHRFWTKSEVCEFLEFSTHDNPDDSIRLVESGPVPYA